MKRGDVGTRFKAIELTRAVGAKVLLDGVSFEGRAGELIAVVGPSGAGKSTLIKALAGASLADSGCVYLNSVELHRENSEFRGLLGFVPQDDVVPMDLTVERVLWYAARLRLAADLSSNEIKQLVWRTLETLGIAHKADSCVRRLSGGERKRVNVAVELLSSPEVLLMDEPSTGLDPGLERQMLSCLRRIADDGKVVIVSTHSAETLPIYDKVLVLAPGGKQLFFGKPQEALTHFGVATYAEIYDFLSDGVSQHVAPVKPNLTSRTGLSQSGFSEKPQRQPAATVLRQAAILTCRYAETIISDRRNLALLLLQAPVIAALIVALFSHDIYKESQQAGENGNFPIGQAATLLFLLTLSAIWCGTCNSVRELVKERPLYAREKLLGVSSVAYLGSKLLVLASLCVVQVLLLWLVVESAIPLGGEGVHSLFLFGWMLLSAAVALSLGLAVSAHVSSSDQAASLLPVLLIPQVLLGGLLVPLESMGEVGRIVSALSISRWGYGGVTQDIDLVQRLEAISPELGKTRLDVFDTASASAVAVLSLFSLLLLAATGLALKRRCSQVL